MIIKKIGEKYRSLPIQITASFWFLICGFMTRGIGVITTPIFTRILNTNEYGEFSVFNSWYGIVSVFVTLNLFSGVYTQGLVKYDKRKEEYSSSLQGLCLTLFLIWTLIYVLFSNFWNSIFSLSTIQTYSMIFLAWLSAVFQFWAVAQRVEFKYKKLVILTIFISILQPLLGVTMVLNSQDKVTARIVSLVIVQFIVSIGLLIKQMKVGKVFFSKYFWKNALQFNIPLIPHYLSMTVLNSADRIMIGKIINNASSGIYNLAYSLSQIMTIFNMALMQTIEPWLYKKIKNKEIEQISFIVVPSFIGIAAVNIMLMLFAPEIVTLFAPPTYYEAIWVVPPIAMSVYFMFAYTFFAVFEFYYEKTSYVMIASTFGALVNILLNYICIKKWGYLAAAYTTLFCYILFALLHYVFMRKICNEYLDNECPYSIKPLLIITIVFMVLSFTILFTYNRPYLRFTFIILIFSIAIVKRRTVIQAIKITLSVKKEGDLK